MPSVNFGNVFTSGSQVLLGGTNTGFDTESIVNTLVEARSVPITQAQDKIDVNTNKKAAFGELQSLLETFRSAADFLRNVPGIQNEQQNIFSYRGSSISSNTSVSGDTYLSVTAEPGTQLGVTDIEISTIAAAKADISNTSFSDKTSSVVEAAGGVTAGLFSAGVITLNALGTDVDITLEDGDNLVDIVAKINSQKNTSGAEASVLKVAEGDFRLVIKSTLTGLSNAFTLTDDGSGVLDEVSFSETQAAADATFNLDGIPITRSSNSVNDVIDGLTLNLRAATPLATTLSVEVSADTELVSGAIVNFADAYNALKAFVANQQARDDEGNAREGADLIGNTSLRNIGNQVVNEATSLVNGLAQTFNDLSDIGIEFDDFDGDANNAAFKNIMIIDTDALQSALESDFDSVRKIFEFDFSSDSTDLAVFSRTNAISITSFVLDIDTTAKTATATFDDNGTPKVINLDYDDSSGSVRLTGQDGTELQGLVMLYTDTVDDSITVNLSQGIGDRIYNALNTSLQAGTGIIDVEVDSLSARNTRLQEDIIRLNDRIESYKLRLLEQFSSLESALSQVNSILQSLDALDSARQQNN